MTMIEFAHIPAGPFTMGAGDGPHPEDGEGPSRSIDLTAYEISTTAVTNRDFAEFVAATGYRTLAERRGGSHVFMGQLDDPDAHQIISPLTPWWRLVKGACWRRPNGFDACADALPVVHISLPDALAYCHWSNARLPTEAEWEKAAGSQEGITPHVWQGVFPDNPTAPPWPKPVREARINEHGLFHACGNVWEWTADRFTRLHSPRRDKNPKGPLNGDLFVVKGGSFLCAPSYCARYRPSSRRSERPEASTSHLGFRVARGERF
jgi:sulfatase modifying factor 1